MHTCVCSADQDKQRSEKQIVVIFTFSFFFLGDPHQFEQKFNYRRPMYPILKYMWGKENYRESIKVTRNKVL